jgi:hypothetical protein
MFLELQSRYRRALMEAQILLLSKLPSLLISVARSKAMGRDTS